MNVNGKPRGFRLVVALGSPGSGKTSLVDEWIADWRRASPSGTVAILDPAGQWPGVGEWPDHPKDERGPEEKAEDWLRAFRPKRKAGIPPPCLLVLDDADNYLGGTQPRGIWRDLFTTFRHWRCDVIVSARRSQDLPKVVFTSASVVALFSHREVYSREYVARYLGPDVVKEIPKEPHRYLLVNVDEGSRSEHKTKRRAIRVAADL